MTQFEDRREGTGLQEVGTSLPTSWLVQLWALASEVEGRRL
jgi:hypothetical protein